MTNHRRILAAAATLAVLPGAAPASSADVPGWCRYALSDVPKGAPAFADYAVPRERIARPAPVDVRTGAAHRYRSALQSAAAGGVNFAGHYTIASWGCGTGCLSWAVIDAKSGKAMFAPGMSSFSNDSVDFQREAAMARFARQEHATYVFGVLMFRADSSLLITLGAPTEGAGGAPNEDGVAYYRWTGKAFVKRAFYPAAEICPKPKD